tara:strand:+ start:1788 stop:3755 length:1968 start_codon:yes stop_codon:yes gene_type:complete
MLSDKKLKELYYYLKMPRFIEERMLLLLRQGKISKWFSGIGQEAISVGSTYALDKNDVVFPMHRNLGVFTTRNVDEYKLFCQLFGKRDGHTQGRDRTFHFGSMDDNIIGMISHLAAMMPVANGIGLSIKLRKENRIALSFTGDGATSEGDFHEALNIASVWNLPVIFLIENNGYGLSTPVKEQYNCKKLSDRAIGYGIEGITINGNDVLEVYDTISKCRKKILKGSGPILIEAMTFRVRGHEEASGVKYVPNNIIEKWKKNDPIKNYEKFLKSKIFFDNNFKSSVLEKIESKVLNKIDEALNSENLKTDENTELDRVYFDKNYVEKKPEDKFEQKRFVDAIKDCLEQKLEDDSKVIIFGQDIAEYGGVFKVTEGFSNKFGKNRVINTPITESGIIGTAMGAAIEGFKPIVEMQFADFVSVGFNQIVNNLAKTYYRWHQPVNVTLRMPTGGGIGAGPFHSQSTEAWFFHVPGLKIVYPSSPKDAKGLLLSSIDDDNPVLFFEHKALYRSVKENVPNNLYHCEIGKGKILNKGTEITLVTYGLGVIWINNYLSENPEQKSKIEVIDLRTLLPWDRDIVVDSLSKTNKLMLLSEDNLTGSITSDISSYISQYHFNLLDAPIIRLGSLDMPIPFSSDIEKNIYFPINKIHENIQKLLMY